MLSREEIKTLKAINSVLKITSDYARARGITSIGVKSLSIVVLDKLNLADKKIAIKLAKNIGAELICDKNLGSKITSLSETDLRENNTFIMFEETNCGVYLYLVWNES